MRRLRLAKHIDSGFKFSSADDADKPSSRVTFSLGEERTGFTRYRYTVYNTAEGYYTPKFSGPEYFNYMLYLIGKLRPRTSGRRAS